MKKENVQSPSKAPQRDEDRWVDVHDDALMIELGIRPAALTPRDKSVWTKTPYEQRLLKSLRRSSRERIHFHTVPEKSIPVRAKLIIQLKKNDKFPKTTYSTECWQHEIRSILLNYYQRNKKTGINECLVSKYTYNGKTYGPNEKPFWPGA
jgi:hypothetical protein|nr:MAG TPA: hypothetical protein [Caudoviricetes sp.]